MIDTLEYTKKLEAVGLTREQAKAFVTNLVHVMNINFATKNYLKEEAANIRAEMKDIRNEFVNLESCLTIKMGALMKLL